MDGFINYLISSGKLCESSIKDDISRMKSMNYRNIDFTRGEDYAKELLLKSNLSESTIRSCLTLCRKYTDYLSKST